MRIPTTLEIVEDTVGKTVKAAIQGINTVLIQFTDGETIAFGAMAADWDGNLHIGQVQAYPDVDFDDFDMDELFASGIVTEEAVQAYYDQEEALAKYREAERKEERRKEYLRLKAEFEPDSDELPF